MCSCFCACVLATDAQYFLHVVSIYFSCPLCLGVENTSQCLWKIIQWIKFYYVLLSILFYNVKMLLRWDGFYVRIYLGHQQNNLLFHCKVTWVHFGRFFNWILLIHFHEKIFVLNDLWSQKVQFLWNNKNWKLFFIIILWGHWYPCFGLLVTSPLGFKSRVGSLIRTWHKIEN